MATDFLSRRVGLAPQQILHTRNQDQSGRAADIVLTYPKRSSGSIHRICLSALVTHPAIEAWYDPSIA
jgi:hypothetical protein